ncbi:2-succinyl-6-hydroxy-2,4-cyclohexadiene-1-carboxylate synthase [Salinivibrio sp. IB574]|uniref:2-succinyl-6-hydroxy-2, 4-cyclohexadiene-1-carboxylate synthase n=1 Tax=Salinivibrio sp. IB574 TaxID=1909444 RepID=UPI00098972B9|nr:2-succinyl-6-hydroxy-2,4-cyclohexadiene-1-carboxylate synthase [Salinivibrio sp. IB574]OOF21213.1 2-succinyl-6-hydroxy-2,4-cyclohexadiene-1-carboxylate synthase [Salinivibrio sp. IB574]
MASRLTYRQGGDPNGPRVVFLHGLLGCGDDWQAVTAALSHCHWLCLDLPGHGESWTQQCQHFDDACDAILTTCEQVWERQPALLVGYSLGARLAMHCATYAPTRWSGVLLEGGHPGLADNEARQQRLAHDKQWATRFRHQPLDAVLDDWYRQPVFQSLDESARCAMVQRRLSNHGSAVADTLLATSLGHQADLRSALKHCFQHGLVIDYLCGEHDKKFHALAKHLHQTTGIGVTVIPEAGHNCHQSNPQGFVHALLASAAFQGVAPTNL